MKIKVCGLKYPENIQSVAALQPDFMGFIFYNKTPRFVAGLEPQYVASLPAIVYKTGVFVNEDVAVINSTIDKFDFDAVQLHGGESPGIAASLRNKVKVIKAFGIDETFDFEKLKSYINHVDFFLFDAKTPIHGGSGKTFNWAVLDKYQFDVPFFLSGGISLDNLAAINKIKHPQFYGVDLNSRFETAPGMKNIAQLKKAFTMLKQLNADEIRS